MGKSGCDLSKAFSDMQILCSKKTAHVETGLKPVSTERFFFSKEADLFLLFLHHLFLGLLCWLLLFRSHGRKIKKYFTNCNPFFSTLKNKCFDASVFWCSDLSLKNLLFSQNIFLFPAMMFIVFFVHEFLSLPFSFLRCGEFPARSP